MPKIKTFGFNHTRPPADATLIVDCRRLDEFDIYLPRGNDLLNLALAHVKENPSAVVAFGCHYGQVRSVGLAQRLGRIIGVEPEPHKK